MQILHFDQGRKVFKEMDQVQKFYFIVKGQFNLTKHYMPVYNSVSDFMLDYEPFNVLENVLVYHEQFFKEIKITTDYIEAQRSLIK